jgi:glycosyltransferase involved in cell wall biosynthesis
MNSNLRNIVLVELRPALDGYAGIPQETRLLFSGLAGTQEFTVQGLLQTSIQYLPEAIPVEPHQLAHHEKINRCSKLVIALSSGRKKFKFMRFLQRKWLPFWLLLTNNILSKFNTLDVSMFKSNGFEDFIWARLFSKSLHANEFKNVTTATFLVLRMPWNAMNLSGIWSRMLTGRAKYPNLNITNVQVFISQTPYPAKLSTSTKLVIRYHDAVPIYLPHTISNMAIHQAGYYLALRDNVGSGAYFACVSEASRASLLSIFPEVSSRAVCIENMVSHHYFLEEKNSTYVKNIIETHSKNSDSAGKRHSDTVDLKADIEWPADTDYILMVSTLEPRKNHLTLLKAFENIRLQHGSKTKLVLVGSKGWNAENIMEKIVPGIRSGYICWLSGVPSDELRVLYRNAILTVCPSIAEGFDYSGVEAMCSGCVVLASDIAVHREIYADAAEYFNTYDVLDLEAKLHSLLSKDEAILARIKDLKIKGVQYSQKFRPDQIMPKWRTFLESIIATE